MCFNFKKYQLGIGALMFLFLMGCSNPSNHTPEQEQLLEQIGDLSKEVYQNEKPIDLVKGEELLKYLTKYTNSYREDSISAVFLLDAAQLAASMGRYQKAIDLLMNYAEHPKATKLDYATYLVGYEYDAHLKQPANAEKYYRATIERYPDSQWAKTANQSLQWLGMSDEEMVRKLEEINQQTSGQ
ncbi:MAG: Outer rane lipoprotein [Bacteroidota bacterium]|jgi:tetratricopeptide (TPR) repeat protein